MKYLAAVLLLSGCTASFQPFPPQVTREEINALLKQRDDNLQIVYAAVKELQEKSK